MIFSVHRVSNNGIYVYILLGMSLSLSQTGNKNKRMNRGTTNVSFDANSFSMYEASQKYVK